MTFYSLQSYYRHHDFKKLALLGIEPRHIDHNHTLPTELPLRPEEGFLLQDIECNSEKSEK
jgi:hypothetical protein